MNFDYLKFAENCLGEIISSRGLLLTKHDKSAMGEWYVYYENPEFIVGVSKDRSEFTSIEVGSKKRTKPRAHLKGTWSLSHLRGFLEANKGHYKFSSLKEEALWFKQNQERVFDSSLLNSSDLTKWSIRASKSL